MAASFGGFGRNAAPAENAYVYRKSARGPGHIAFSIVVIALFVYATRNDASWFVLAVAAAVGTMTLVPILLGTRGAMVLDDHWVAFHHGRRILRLPLREIERVEINEWSDSRDVYVHTRSGTRQSISDWCVPRSGVLRREFERRGVTVERT